MITLFHILYLIHRIVFNVPMTYRMTHCSTFSFVCYCLSLSCSNCIVHVVNSFWPIFILFSFFFFFCHRRRQIYIFDKRVQVLSHNHIMCVEYEKRKSIRFYFCLFFLYQKWEEHKVEQEKITAKMIWTKNFFYFNPGSFYLSYH